MDTVSKKSFNARAFLSVGMLASGLFLPISGIMNHELQFEAFSIERHLWMSLHNSAALLFTIFLIIHLRYNWSAVGKYMHRARQIVLSKEAALAISLVLFVVGLFALHAFRVG